MAATKKKAASKRKATVKAKPVAPLFYYLENKGDDITAGADPDDPVLATLPNLIAYEFGTVSEGEQPPAGAETFKTQAQLDRRIAKTEQANDAEFDRAEKAADKL